MAREAYGGRRVAGRSQEDLGGHGGVCRGAVSCHDAVVLPYAAYLRVYEPLAAFAEPERSIWAAYAESAGRPRRAGALDVEHTLALYRLIAVPPIVVPVRESRDAYVRRAEGVTYICPWQTRLRSWLAFEQFRENMPDRVTAMFVPDRVAAQADVAFEQFKCLADTLTTHIRSSTWHVPLAWFVPFVAKERWLVLGTQGDGGSGGPATAAPTRTLIYVTSMAQARRRVARALHVIRRSLGDGFAHGEVETIGRWLEEFHPHSLVELDYGGLVHALDDDALRADESVAEVAAALTAMETHEEELATAMYQRAAARWRVVRALESAN